MPTISCPSSLYLHIPFCTRRCIYCDFAIAVRKEVPAARYVNAALREREFRMDTGDWQEPLLEALYFGGGTPSLLPPEHLARLVRELGGAESASGVHEVTLEVNPEHVSPQAALAWARGGFNRVSLGVQSFDARVLDWMHRTHDVEQAKDAVRLLRDAGVASVSIDLIFALPPELPRVFAHDLEQAVALAPDHVSVYGLTVEPHTALARRLSRGEVSTVPDDRYADEYLLAHETLAAEGYDHYEVSNYARPGHRSRHNTKYWDGSAYIGIGPSAHAFDGCERRWNVRHWAEYERAVAAGEDPTGGREMLTKEQVFLERVYLALRTSDGLPAESLEFLNDTALARAEAQQWAFREAGSWCLSPEGWLRIDELVAGLTTLAEGG